MKRYSFLAEGFFAGALFLGLFGYAGAYLPVGRLYTMILALLGVPFALLARRRPAGLAEAATPLLLLWAALAAAQSPMPRTAIESTAVVVMGGLVFLAAPSIEGRFLNGAFLAAAIGLAGSILFETLGATLLLGTLGLFVQPAGYLGNANFSGVVLAAALLVVLSPGPSRFAPRVRGLFVAVLLAPLLLTGSRTAVLSLGLGLVALHGFTRRSALLLAGLAGLAFLVFLQRIDLLLDPMHLTNLQRVAMARTAWAGVQDAPLLGFGLGTFPVLGVRYLAFPKWELHLHDLFLDALFALGIPGLLFVLSAWVAGLVSAFRRRDGVAAGILASLVTDDLLWLPGFLLLAALYVRGRDGFGGETPPVAPPHEGFRMGGAMVTAILGAVLMVFGGGVPAFAERAALRAKELAPTAPLDAAREIFPDRPGLLAARWSLLARGGVVDRVDLDRVGGAEALEDPGFARQAALLYEAHGEIDDALFLLAFALRNDPKNVLGPHHLDLARIHLGRGDASLGDSAAAVRHLLEADAKMPRLAEVFRRIHGLGPSDTSHRAPEAFTADHAYRLEERDEEPTLDPLHFRYYRIRAAEAFARGDLATAAREIRRANFLAQREVGKDPRTLRLLVDIGRARGEKTDAIAWALYQARPPRGPYGAAAIRAYARSLPADGELAKWMGGPR